MSIEDTLKEREQQHGSFETHAAIEVSLMRIVNASDSLFALSNVQRVGLHMIMHKIARILNNGYSHTDSWHDIAGYATLVEQYMLKIEAIETEVKELDEKVPDFTDG